MIDLIIALTKVLDQSAKQAISDWLEASPKRAAWHLISDYVFDDPDRHDTASFVVLLHHDSLDTILGYIQNQAPSDIKRTRDASPGLIRYLNSSVVFSFTFVLDEGDRFLASYSSIEEMIGGLEELGRIADAMSDHAGNSDPYYMQARQRFEKFSSELRHRGNAKLARQIFLVAAYAAVVLDYLDQVTDPAFASWVSDRDALLERHDGVVWDVAAFLFYLMKGRRTPTVEATVTRLSVPEIMHIRPEKEGPNYLDPLIRMPDYLAAAASDMNLQTLDQSKSKLADISASCFAGSANHVLCTVTWTGMGFFVRRLRLVRDPLSPDRKCKPGFPPVRGRT
ncbi:hypothetical protein [Xanthomonas arboricola]|uniref:Uncharacterized protein n=1 Tax=Xanthomonas arboricola TaxID=56448 RepID=A0AAU9I0W0_9XANT|nr:hypothetical protein [Xanthomonas arboricola]CAE6827872.1 hypothetical protein XA1314C_35030 [Xanthomonas arboricola]CAE6827896.1 hypothetical protein XA1314C_35030 [Xanthomonas arboricola]